MDIPNTVADVLDVLANKFGAQGKELWAAILKQQQIDGWVGVGEVVLVVALDLIVMVPWFNWCASIDEYVSAFAVWGAFFALLNLIGLMLVEYSVTHLFNPIYSATKEVTDMLKPSSV